MTEKVVIEGKGTTLEEWLSSEISIDNASSENTQLRVLKELENISAKFGASKTAAQKAEEDMASIMTEAMQANRLMAREASATASKSKNQTDLQLQIIDKFGTEIQHLFGNVIGMDVDKLKDILSTSYDDISKVLDAYHNTYKASGASAMTAEVERAKLAAMEAKNFKRITFEQEQLLKYIPAAAQGTFKKGLDLINNYAGLSTKDLLTKGASRILRLSPTASLALTGAFAAVTAAVGIFKAALGPVINTINEWNQTLFESARSGIAFSNNLMEMRSAAADAGMGLKEFVSLIQKNSTVFAQFGLTATQGARELSKLSNNVLRKYGAELAMQGVSINQVNELLPYFMTSLKAGTQTMDAFGKSTSVQADSLKRLITETDLMAKITGKQREKIAEEVARKTNDMAFQNALSKMDAAEREKVIATMTRMQGQFGELGGDLVKLRVLGLPPMTEAQRLATAALGETVTQINKATDSAMNTNVSAIQHQKELDDASIKAMSAAVKESKGFEAVIAAGAAGLGGTADGLAKVFNEMALSGVKFKDKNGNVNEEAIRQMYARAREEQRQKDAMKSIFDKFSVSWKLITSTFFSNIMKPIYNIFGTALYVLGDLFEGVGAVVESIIRVLAVPLKLISAIFDGLKPAIAVIGFVIKSILKFVALIIGGIASIGEFIISPITAIGKQINDFFNSDIFGKMKESFTKFVDMILYIPRKIIDFIKGMFSGTSNLVGGMFSGLVNLITSPFTAIKNAFSAIADVVMSPVAFLKNAFTNLIDIIMFVPRKIGEFLSGGIKSMFGWVKGSIGSAVDCVTFIPRKLGEFLVNSFKSVFTTIKEKVTSFFETIFSIPAKVIGYVVDKFTGLKNIIGGFIDTLLTIPRKVIDFFSNMFSSVTSGVGSFVNKIISIPGKVVDFFGRMFGNLKDTAMSFIDGFLSIPKAIGGFISDGFSAIKDAVVGFATSIIELPSKAINFVLDGFSNFGKTIMDGIMGFFKDLFGGITSLWGKVTNLFGWIGKKCEPEAEKKPSTQTASAATTPTATTTGTITPTQPIAQTAVANIPPMFMQNTLYPGQTSMLGQLDNTSKFVTPSAPNLETAPTDMSGYMDRLENILLEIKDMDRPAVGGGGGGESVGNLEALQEQLMRIASLMEEQVSVSRDQRSAIEDLSTAIG